MRIDINDPLAKAVREATNAGGVNAVICRVGDEEFRLNQWHIRKQECHDETVFDTRWDGPEVVEGLLSRARRSDRWKFRFSRLLRDLGHR